MRYTLITFSNLGYALLNERVRGHSEVHDTYEGACLGLQRIVKKFKKEPWIYHLGISFRYWIVKVNADGTPLKIISTGRVWHPTASKYDKIAINSIEEFQRRHLDGSGQTIF